MNAMIQEKTCQRQSERRDAHADHLMHAETAEAPCRGYNDRRADAEWRYSWLRARVRRSLRD